MTDALLASEQQMSGLGLESPRTSKIAIPREAKSQSIIFPKSHPRASVGPSFFHAGQTLEASDVIQHYEEWLGPVRFALEEKAIPIDVQLGQAKNALHDLAHSNEHASALGKFENEQEWLRENRQRYVGQWIALQGKQLLAVGASASEVFSLVADQHSPPLVIHIEEQERPFAGW